MKKFFLPVLIALGAFHAVAQPSNIPYQLHFTAVARNPTTHAPVTSSVDVRLEVWQSASTTSFVPDDFYYCEEVHTIATNSFGEFSVNFGTSAAVICITGTTLANTPWEAGNMWYIIKYSTDGGTFVPIDTGRFTSTTYSYAAHTAEKLVNAGTAPAVGSTLTWNGTDWAAATPSGVLPGTIQAWAGQTVPAGYVVCDGSIVNSETYPMLYAAIGTAWGNGTGAAGSFNLPDLRGRFLRGYSGASSNDPDKSVRTAIHPGGATGNNVGSYQVDTFSRHNHNDVTDPISGATFQGMYSNKNDFLAYHSNSNVWSTDRGSRPEYYHQLLNSSLANKGGNETRPKNAGVMYIIKY